MDGIWQQNIVDEWKNGGKVEVVLGSICSKILKSRVVVVVEDDEVDVLRIWWNYYDCISDFAFGRRENVCWKEHCWR